MANEKRLQAQMYGKYYIAAVYDVILVSMHQNRQIRQTHDNPYLFL